MINFISLWVKNLSLAIIVVSILEMLLPNNKIKKYIKVVMGIYILFTIIEPFVKNSKAINLNELNFNTYVETTNENTEKIDQTSLDNRLNQIYKERLEEDITKKIENMGYTVGNCKVTAHISNEDSGIEKIILNIESKILKEENSNEVINENTDIEAENQINNDNFDNKVENVIIKEVEKIKKININEDDEENNEKSTSKANTKITRNDIVNIKKFLINEYGVNEKCLKIN